MEPQPPSKKQKIPPPIPTVPDGWDRCHAYMEKKGRFCRQEVLPALARSGHSYCGNHRHFLCSSESLSSLCTTMSSAEGTPLHREKTDPDSSSVPVVRKRISCPIDPTHHIYEDMLEIHIEKCPKTIEQRKQQQQSFYCHNCNCGGHGRLVIERSQQPTTTGSRIEPKNELEWAKAVAMTVLITYRRLFPTPLEDTTDSTQITVDDISDNNYVLKNSIPFVDLSQPELDAGFITAITNHRIKSGGVRHIHQQASMIGHLRRIGILSRLQSETATNQKGYDNDDSISNGITPPHECDTYNDPTAAKITVTRTILEMGAGRGMTGLVVAGVSALDTKANTHFTMIERSASRSRAEKVLRKVRKYDNASPLTTTATTTATNYMNLSNMQWNRIQCDLSHVNISSTLIPTTTVDTIRNSNDGRLPVVRRRHDDLVVIAKHLCGVGTDLALKSIEPIRDHVTAVIMSTCCHGVCSWNDYVGRDYLIDAMLSNKSILSTFGEDEFDLLRLWSSGTVQDIVADSSKSSTDESKPKEDEHCSDLYDSIDDDNDNHTLNETINEICIKVNMMNVTTVVEALDLNCGVRGLGRSCQRLIDYGRREYLRYVIFGTTSIVNDAATITKTNTNNINPNVELVYYVPESVTPQNALLIAYR